MDENEQYIGINEDGSFYVTDDPMLLKLVRSDEGDGGWSLHDGDGQEEPELLLSGTAEKDYRGEWSRPDAQDIRAALSLQIVRHIAEKGVYTDDELQEDCKLIVKTMYKGDRVKGLQ